jgi:hypothetical protein
VEKWPTLSQVRGTPASGKSTLAELLSRDIKQNEPGVELALVNSWPGEGTEEGNWCTRLRRGYSGFDPHRTDKLVLIIDEAQLCYWDNSFWNGFLKTIDPDSLCRVILFASYGSPTKVSEDVHGTPMNVPARQRVGLAPVDHKDGIAGVGLFLQPGEFDDMIKKRYPHHFFDTEFLQYALDFTAGHAGAANDFFRVVVAHDVSPCIAP